MDIRKERDGDVLILSLGGEFDAVETEGFCSVLDDALEEGVRKVLLDLDGVQFMDSSAIKCILNADRDIAERSGRFSVARPKAMVAKVLDRLQIGRVIHLHDTLDDARAALND